MVFKQTFEEDIVDSTGVVKGGSAPPLLPRPAHPVFDLASRQPEIAEHGLCHSGTHTAGAKIAVYREGARPSATFASAATIPAPVFGNSVRK